MSEHALAELVARYRKTHRLTQEAVAARLSDVLGRRIAQSQVSDNEKGARWSDPDLQGAYVRALEIPVDEMLAATGYPKPAKTTKPVTLADLIKSDPTLTPAARKHLLTQYTLLQAASAHERSQDRSGRNTAG